MGYTHYWSFKAIPKGKIGAVEKLYQQAIRDINRACLAYQKQFESGDFRRLSGYSAYTNKYGGVKINGSREYSHEDFVLREHYNQNRESCYFGFCKTAEKPYDVVITAALSILKYRLGDLVDVSSDGRPMQWNAGVLLASSVLKRKIKNPIMVRIRRDLVCV